MTACDLFELPGKVKVKVCDLYMNYLEKLRLKFVTSMNYLEKLRIKFVTSI